MWSAAQYFGVATIFFPHNVCAHFIGFDILQAHACNVLYIIIFQGGRERERNVLKNVRKYIRFSPTIYFILSEWSFVGTLYLNLISCMCVFFFSSLFFKGGGRKNDRWDDGCGKTTISWWWWWWYETFEKFLTIMMSISWKVGKKSFHLIFFPRSLPFCLLHWC